MHRFQFMALEAFAVAFTYAAFSQNWLESTGVVSVILFLIFWASDGVMSTDVQDTYYHIWLMVVIVCASLAGHVYSRVMTARPLVRTTYRSKEEEVKLPAADVVTAFFILSFMGFVAGLNMWLQRLTLGLAPLGFDYETGGIAVTCSCLLLMLVLSGVLSTLDVRARVTLKYVWLFCMWPLAFLATDYGFYKYKWSSPWPELTGFFVYAGVSALVTIAAIYLPVKRPYEDPEGSGMSLSFDEFYHNTPYAILFFGGIAITVEVAFAAFTAIASWPGSDLRRGALVTGGVGVLSIAFSLMLFYFSANLIQKTKTKGQKMKKDTVRLVSVRQRGGSLFESN